MAFITTVALFFHERRALRKRAPEELRQEGWFAGVGPDAPMFREPKLDRSLRNGGVGDPRVSWPAAAARILRRRS